MGFIKNALRKVKLSAAEQRKLEELLHEIVDDEMQSGDIKRGLWTKALAEADGDERRARAKYITLRVQSLTDELLLFSDALGEAQRRRNGGQNTTEPKPIKPEPVPAKKPERPITEHPIAPYIDPTQKPDDMTDALWAGIAVVIVIFLFAAFGAAYAAD